MDKVLIIRSTDDINQELFEVYEIYEEGNSLLFIAPSLEVAHEVLEAKGYTEIYM